MDNTQGISTTKACKNCGSDVQGTYCTHCGEKYSEHRLTVGHMLHELVHLITHFDKGFLYTLKRLIISPGVMQKEYIAGKRKNYQKPFSMFFVCGTISALALYWINKAVIHLYHDEMDAGELQFYQHNFALLQMALVPVYALINWLAYLKNKYNYAEMLVILLYNTSVLLLVTVLANSFKLAFGMIESGYAEVGFVLIYNFITFFNVFDTDKKWVVALKVLITSVLCFTVSRFASEMFIHIFAGSHH